MYIRTDSISRNAFLNSKLQTFYFCCCSCFYFYFILSLKNVFFNIVNSYVRKKVYLLTYSQASAKSTVMQTI